MNWLQLLFTGLSAAPYVVAGVEAIHKNAPASTKTQIALQSLNLAENTAAAILPDDQAHMASAVASEAASIINSLQKIHAVVSTPTTPTTPTAPALPASTQSAS